MNEIVSLRIHKWQGKFVVVGEFETHSVIPRQEFATLGEALKEFSKIAQREELRYEHGIGRGSTW